jgi:soluble lytic murein transglycosylase
MKTHGRHRWAWIGFLAAMVAGCASAPARPAAASPPLAANPPPPPASEPASPAQAFADGYRAYRNHDLPTAIDRLGYASEHYPVLADYALFYLGSAERDSGDLAAAAKNLERLIESYPNSVMAPEGEVVLADVYLRLTRASDSAARASAALAMAPNPQVEQEARLALARAMAAQGNPRGACDELMTLRQKYPRGARDADARSLAYSILAANPEIANRNSAEYHRDEAELLLREGQHSLALREVRAGLALEPPRNLRAELTFLEARALSSRTNEAEAAYQQYLRLAPAGPSADAALQALALIAWRRDDRVHARALFGKLVARFPRSRLAPAAMLRTGRILEEDRKYDAARANYQRLIARYPSSEAAAEARFRSPWTWYMTGRYALAAEGFAAARAHARSDAAARDMFGYWEARAREKNRDRAGARILFASVAQSIDSNYYPALAARRINAPMPDLPAATAPDPPFDPDLTVQGGGTQFHLERVLALRALGLRDLEPAELKQLQADAAQHPALRSFILAGLQSAGAYHDAIVAATAMEKRGEVDHAVAERVRYPRAYWELVSSNASRNGLDPLLVTALMRQESWFNPNATSSSDARGLMQLLPSTAMRLGRENGVAVAPANLYDPTLNVELGTAYLRKLMTMFNGDEIRAIAAYNGGEHAVAEWSAKFPGADDELVENIGYRETREYVKRVVGGMREYRMLYRSAPPASSAAAAQPGLTARAD